MLAQSGNPPPANRLPLVAGKQIVVVTKIELRFKMPALSSQLQIFQAFRLILLDPLTGKIAQGQLEVLCRVLNRT